MQRQCEISLAKDSGFRNRRGDFYREVACKTPQRQAGEQLRTDQERQVHESEHGRSRTSLLDKPDRNRLPTKNNGVKCEPGRRKRGRTYGPESRQAAWPGARSQKERKQSQRYDLVRPNEEHEKRWILPRGRRIGAPGEATRP